MTWGYALKDKLCLITGVGPGARLGKNSLAGPKKWYRGIYNG